jgi:hypothetical protein
MGNIATIYTAMLTRSSDNSGTDSSIELVMNVQGRDFLQYTFPDTSQNDQGQGQANLYSLAIFNDAGVGLDPKLIPATYYRVGIRGDDSWRPEHFFIWGITNDKIPFVVPLAIGLDLTTSNLERNGGASSNVDQIVLSTSQEKGDLTFPVPLVGIGNNATLIKRLIFVMTTADQDDAGTDDTITLKVAGDDGLLVNFVVPDTPQAEQDRGQANFYIIPVPPGFIKRSLQPDAITISIDGSDAWLPASMFLFGLDTEEGMPTTIVPLVSLRDWPFGALSTDDNEGQPEITLPVLVP